MRQILYYFHENTELSRNVKNALIIENTTLSKSFLRCQIDCLLVNTKVRGYNWS